MTKKEICVRACMYAINELTRKGSTLFMTSAHDGNAVINWDEVVEWLAEEYGEVESGIMKIEIPDNCGRLIDADALKEEYSDGFFDDDFRKALCDTIDGAPTIWGGKKRKAYGAPHWVAVENDEMEITGYYCSNCDLPMETEEQTDYCPNCGAKMEKSEEKE